MQYATCARMRPFRDTGSDQEEYCWLLYYYDGGCGVTLRPLAEAGVYPFGNGFGIGIGNGIGTCVRKRVVGSGIGIGV